MMRIAVLPAKPVGKTYARLRRYAVIRDVARDASDAGIGQDIRSRKNEECY
jgi:hypothetical protein